MFFSALKNQKSVSVTILALFIVVILLTSCSSDSEPTYGDDWSGMGPTTPLYFTELTVKAVMGDPSPPIKDLSDDPRIDWENCAKSASEATTNMTGYVVDGVKPLIALSHSSGSVNPISYYLHKEAEITKHRYWLKNETGELCTITDYGWSNCLNCDCDKDLGCDPDMCN